MAPRRGFLFERLEDRMLLSATPLGTQDLIFDPTPSGIGGEVDIGSIDYVLDGTDIKITYRIGNSNQAIYDLSGVETTINDGTLGYTNTTDLPDNTESYTHTFTLSLPLSVSQLDINACATIDKRDVGTVGAALPAVGTVNVSFGANITGLPSYFDTILTPGWIPTSTDIVNDNVTFASDPGWATGAAVRVVQSYTTVPTNTGLVTPPTGPDTTTSATYFVQNLGANTYSFHATYNEAISAINPKDILAAVPTNGEMIIAGENDALSFLGQMPVNESLVPASTKMTLTTTTGPTVTATDTTNDTVDLSAPGTWVSGDRVQVSATGGGLTAGTTYFVRNLDGDTVSFHTTWAGATAVLPTVNRVNITAAIALTTTVNSVDGDDETVTFGTDPVWPTGTPVRVSATGGGLSAGTTYFARSLGGGVYSFFDTAANATNTDASPDPLNGRKDLTLPITASVFANLTTVSFDNDHNWATGTVVRVAATGGGLTLGTNYYVRAIDNDTISLHTTLANAQGDISPVTFTAPITALVTPMFDGWCVDEDRLINPGREYIANFFSSYELSSFPDTTNHPKDQFGTDAGLLPVNTSATPLTTNTTTDQVTFSAAHVWSTGQAVRVTATDDGLSAGTTYYVRSINGTTVSFHPTAAAANNAGPIPASTSFANTGVVPTSTNTIAETVTYSTDPAWADATLVRATVTGGGLTAGTNYYVHNFTGGVYSFYTNQTDATAGGTTGRINLSATIIAQVYTVTLASTDDTVTFNAGHGFATGDIVTLTTSVGGLSSGTAYTLYNLSGDTFSFHTASPTPDNKVNLTAAITTNVNERVDLTAAISASTIVFRAESIDFAVTTNWPTGTKVRVDVSDGGLTAGTNYYARQQNVVGGTTDSNSISFYDTREHAQAGGTTGLITLTDPMETTTKVYVPEDLVENPENLDVVNWVLNQNFQTQLAVGQAPTATNIATTTQVPTLTSFANTGLIPSATNTMAGVETVDFAGTHGWATGDVVRVSATGGGLTAGANNFARVIDADTISFYDTAAHASAGGPTGLRDLTAAITATVYKVDLASTDDTVTFNAGHGFATGSVVNVTADGGGLDAATTYFLYNVSGDTFSFHTAAVATPANKVNLTAAITAGVHLQSDDTVTMTAAPAYGWSTGMKVQVSATGGDLTAGTDYYIRAINATTLGFFATAADASNNENRIDLTAPIEPALVRPYYTGNGGDVQRTVWELIENNPGDPGNWSQTRVNEILALADAAVGLNKASVDYVPDCSGTVAIMIAPFEVKDFQGETNAQVIIAQITIAQIPNYCAEGSSCSTLTVHLGTIGNFVWNDTNGNGIQNDGETGIAGVEVNLLDGSGNTIGTGYTTTTDGSGKYQFTGLLPGTYTVQFVQPDGKVFTAPDAGTDDTIDSDANPANGKTGTYTLGYTSATATVGSNDTADAGLYVPASLGDFVWVDTNGNGQQDGGELGLDGVLVTLTGAGPDGDFSTTGDNTTAYATTSDGGAYSFTGLTPGDYKVTFGAVSDYTRTAADTGTDGTDSDANVGTGMTGVYTLSSGGTENTVDAGYYLPASLGDFVWVDTNGNGQQDGDELGLDGVLVTLTGAGPDGDFSTTGDNTTAYATTSDGGAYSFTGLTPGDYKVTFGAVSDYTRTAADTGTDGTDSDANVGTGMTGVYTLSSGGTNNTVDAGYFKPISISGVKVWDIDRDGATGGISDAGDQRMANIRIFLDGDNDGTLDWTDGDDDRAWDAGEGERWTKTAADGSYSFADLGPGIYYVTEDKTSLPGDPTEWQSSGSPAPITAVSGVNVTNANFYNYQFSLGEYLTYTQGGYQGTGQPGQYLLAHFKEAFPNGLVVPRVVAGSASDIVLKTGAEVQAFLKATKQNKFTNGTVVNYVPTNLETQFVALSLSVTFDAFDPNFASSSSNLGNLTLVNLTGTQVRANGLTISGFLAQVYDYLDGDNTSGNGGGDTTYYTLAMSAGDLTNLLGNLNLAFDVTVTPWAETHLA